MKVKSLPTLEHLDFISRTHHTGGTHIYQMVEKRDGKSQGESQRPAWAYPCSSLLNFHSQEQAGLPTGRRE